MDVVIMKRDLRIMSEGKQILQAIIKKFGDDGISVICEMLELKESSANRYFNNGELSDMPEKTLEKIKQILGDCYVYKTKEQQVEENIKLLEDQFDRHEENEEVMSYLNDVIERTSNYRIKLRARILLIASTVTKDPKGAIALFEQLLTSEYLDDDLRAKINKEIANAYYSTAEYDKCIRYIKRAKSTCEGDPILSAKIYHLSGLVNWTRGKGRSAEEDLKFAYDLYEGNAQKQGYILNLIGAIKIDNEKYKSAKRIYNQAIEKALKSDDDDLLLILYNNSYDAWHDDKTKAYEFIEKGKKIVERGNGFLKSRQILKHNELRYSIRYGETIDTVKRLAKDYPGVCALSYPEIEKAVKFIVKDIKESSNPSTYAKMCMFYIMKISDREQNIEKKKQMHHYFALLGSEIFRGVDNYEEENDCDGCCCFNVGW